MVMILIFIVLIIIIGFNLIRKFLGVFDIIISFIISSINGSDGSSSHSGSCSSGSSSDDNNLSSIQLLDSCDTPPPSPSSPIHSTTTTTTDAITLYTINIMTTHNAMNSHTSQYIWYRKLFIWFSSYSYVNTYSNIVTTSGRPNSPD